MGIRMTLLRSNCILEKLAMATADPHPTPPMPPRHFAHLTRTVNPDGTHTLDAIDQDGRAWWPILGNDEAPEGWTELQPLPSREDRP